MATIGTVYKESVQIWTVQSLKIEYFAIEALSMYIACESYSLTFANNIIVLEYNRFAVISK